MTLGPATCSCGARMVWARHERTDKPAPLVPDPAGRWALKHTTDTILVAGEPLVTNRDVTYHLAPPDTPPALRFTNHFADCPHAGRYRPNA